MGRGALRSQMDVRICFRVRERRDVDLILGQGMLAAGWQAHTLNAPGKFLISAPEHDAPRRTHAYLVTDQAVTETASQHAPPTSPPGPAFSASTTGTACGTPSRIRSGSGTSPPGSPITPGSGSSRSARAGPSLS